MSQDPAPPRKSRKRQTLLLMLLAIMGAVALFIYRDAFLPAPYRTDLSVDEDEAIAVWEAANRQWLPVRLSIVAGNDLVVAADLDDDGTVSDADVGLQSRGGAELVRVNDNFCNGRSPVADRSPLFDDDLQLLVVQLPQGADATTLLRLGEHGGCAIYDSDLLQEEALVSWPLKVSTARFFNPTRLRLFLWLKVFPVKDGPLAVRELEFECGEGATRSTAVFRFMPVGGLGDPNYFAAARDYLLETDRSWTPPALTFVDSFDAEGLEKFRVVVMRHELTKLEVMETYYANKNALGRVRNVFDAVRRRPEATLIVNGNYFLVRHKIAEHGKETLGTLVHDGQVSPAGLAHRWAKQYKPAGFVKDPGWDFPVFTLCQAEEGCGRIELRPEPVSFPRPYVPTKTVNGKEVPVDEAVCGLHTLHDSIYTQDITQSTIGITQVATPFGAVEGREEHKLIFIVMSETNMEDVYTGHSGGAVMRQALRDSGIVIEEANAIQEKAPGRTDIAYLDGGNSVCMAYKIGGEYEIPIRSFSHPAYDLGLHINNYVVFTVGDCGESEEH